MVDSTKTHGAVAAAPTPAVEIVKQPGGRPDQKHHNGEMDRLKSEIDQTHAKIAQIRAALSGESLADSPSGKRRSALKDELTALRNQQAGRKGTRGKVFDELKQVQDDIAHKIKALQQAKSKAPFKSVSELDAQVAQIEAQIESGSMKIVEERKALNDISTLKRARKSVEQFGEQQKEIDELRAQVADLRLSLDDPEMAAANKRYEEIKAEMDELYQARRDRLTAYHAENDKYFARVRADRERRQEAQRKEREEADRMRQEAEIQALREDAALPAFAKEIEDCDVLIRYFSGASEEDTKGENLTQSASKSQPEVPKPDATVPEGAVVARKKGDEDDYFAGTGTGKKKGKGKKSGQQAAKAHGSDEAGGAFNVPFGMLSALLSLSIPPPMNQADVPRLVDNIKLKREYFVSTQPHQTQENMRKAEEKIAALQAKTASKETPAAA